MVKKIKWVGTLSTTERNNIGLIKVRQNNVNSEVLGFNIVDGNGEPYDLKNRKVLFCTYFDRFAPVEQYAEVIENGKIVYTMNEHDMQKPVRINFAYFKIMDDKDNLVDTTQNFSYDIMPSIESKCMNSEPYIIRLEELLEIYENFYIQQKQEALDYHLDQIAIWEKFFNDYREIIESIDPGGILLKEIIETRGMYPTLPDRLNDMPSNQQLNNPFETQFKNIESNQHILEKERVRSVFLNELILFKSKINKSKINIGWATDHHYEERTNKGPYLKNSYSHMINMSFLSDSLDAVIFGGDNTDNGGDWSQLMTTRKMIAQTSIFISSAISKMRCPFFALNGNHDEGTAKIIYTSDENEKKMNDDNVIFDETMKTIFNTKIKLYDEKRNLDSLYGYKDIVKNDEKVRVIFLNAFWTPYKTDSKNNYLYPRIINGGYDQEQLDWLVNNALKVKNDTHVIIFSHAPINGTLGYSLDTYRNHHQLQKILEAFVIGGKGIATSSETDFELNVPFDFTSNGDGNLVGFFCGHIHKDKQETVNGVNYISTTCSAVSLDSMYPERINKVNTVEEEALDVIEIDTKNRKANIKRFGTGSDRSVSY